MSFAVVFPGQGSQSVGMLSSLAADEAVRSTFAEASEVLGYDLWSLVQSGPEEHLDATENQQPAMLAAGVALWRLWRRRGGGDPEAVAGHSLGEFTALVCAGAIEFGAAVDLVRFRGRVMQEAVPNGAGAMAAILGLDDSAVVEACRIGAEGAIVEAVNFNAPGQVVIAGERAAVARAVEAARRLGAKRAITLPVSVPSHSSLMRTAADRLADKLRSTAFAAPRIVYVSAVDAQPHIDPADIRGLLERQVVSPVRWQNTVRALVARGVGLILECGPGKVLTGLNRRIERRPGLQCLAIEDEASIEAALAASKSRAAADAASPHL
ncbi:MAG: ACP S-malonyltransferase [Steroidobacteraceae bacterium]